MVAVTGGLGGYRRDGQVWWLYGPCHLTCRGGPGPCIARATATVMPISDPAATGRHAEMAVVGFGTDACGGASAASCQCPSHWKDAPPFAPAMSMFFHFR